VAWILASAGFLLALASLAGDILGRHYDADQMWPVTRQFDFSEEGNFANWYQSFTLLLCAGLLAAIGAVTRQTGGRYRRHWMGLALVFLFVSIDEAAQVHETTLSPLLAQLRHRPQAHQGSQAEPPAAASEDTAANKGAWMPVYLAILAVVTLVYLRFFFALPPRIRGFFVLAAVLYLGGAVAVEWGCERLAERLGDQPLICQGIATLSELMEMLGGGGVCLCAAFLPRLTAAGA